MQIVNAHRSSASIKEMPHGTHLRCSRGAVGPEQVILQFDNKAKEIWENTTFLDCLVKRVAWLLGEGDLQRLNLRQAPVNLLVLLIVNRRM